MKKILFLMMAFAGSAQAAEVCNVAFFQESESTPAEEYVFTATFKVICTQKADQFDLSVQTKGKRGTTREERAFNLKHGIQLAEARAEMVKKIMSMGYEMKSESMFVKP